MMRGALLLAIAATAACSDADVEGNYTMAVTNRDNGCNFMNWTVGAQSTGIAVAISQEGSDVSASVGGITGGVLDLALGGHVYTGIVKGDNIHLELPGSRAMNNGNCAFTYNSFIDATLDGDAMSGRIDYTAKGNGNPDCAAIEGCVSFQDFNGTRPPP